MNLYFSDPAKMSYYFIVRINIIDPLEYQKYLDKSGEIFRKYKGEYLVVMMSL